MTSSAFQKLCTLVKYDQYLVDQSERIPQQERIPPSSEIAQFLDMQTPFVSYKKSILEEIPEDILPSKDEFSTSSAEKGIIESPQNQLQNNSSMESIACKNMIDC